MHRAALRYESSQQGPPLSDEEVVRRYAFIIDRVARRICSRTANAVQPGDLWSVGALGLLDAWRRFDAARGVKFESFAEYRIRGAMIDELREMDHLPRRLRADADKVRKARHALEASLGREPTNEELAARCDVSIEELDAIEAVAQPTMPLTPELPLASLDASPDERLEHARAIQRLTDAIGRLPERLALLLSLHYVEGLTYKEIARALEVSEARVCQLHGDAVKKLREQLSALAPG
ncbi:MAG: FliA/WhiG family RNA polymerase sigma factor [Myxococcaceae bacterium]|jgi:RNA polymerase sigma factor for flagellar operon FliA|nr:FliA/WhiG family RNA polymerase sigma factor [Myxococcaceae bacterium]